jgi:sporadic carbohydrate cluster protein (TIGR04323 family)
MAEGFRGYIVSTPVRGSLLPQRIQNLVVRDYAARRKLAYRLSVAEHAMPGCTMQLEFLLHDLHEIEGIILISLFALPRNRQRRAQIYDRVFGAGKVLHAAMEQLVVRSADEAATWETMIALDAALPATPFRGRYEKSATPLGTDPAEVAAFRLQA